MGRSEFAVLDRSWKNSTFGVVECMDAPHPQHDQQHSGQAPHHRPRDSQLAESHSPFDFASTSRLLALKLAPKSDQPKGLRINFSSGSLAMQLVKLDPIDAVTSQIFYTVWRIDYR